VGWCAGDLLEPEPLLVVASVQKLARPEHLEQVLAAPPDYVIVDEVHHADAPTYRRVLDALDPAFLLGLTATPDRADDGDVLARFDDFIAYRADLGMGIARGRLVPFAYHGVRDDIDYHQRLFAQRTPSEGPASWSAKVWRRSARMCVISGSARSSSSNS
jgi:superfamily II DNA or RNA helicase